MSSSKCVHNLFVSKSHNQQNYEIRHSTWAADPTRKSNYFYYVIVYANAPVSFLVRGFDRTITFNIFSFSVFQILVINDLMTKQFQKRIHFYLYLNNQICNCSPRDYHFSTYKQQISMYVLKTNYGVSIQCTINHMTNFAEIYKH